MKTIREEARDIPVVANADVIVVGAGPAGLAAAVAAGRAGADVLLIERYGYVGGLATGGLVITMPPSMRGAMVDEIDQSLDKQGFRKHSDLDLDGKGHCWPVWCPEGFKYHGLCMLEEAGVKMLFHTCCVAIQKESDVIKSVIVENKAGRGAVTGRIFIDCSGDADIAAFADAPFAIGEGGKTQPTTLMFMVSNIDESTYKTGFKGELSHKLALTNVYPGYANVWGGHKNGVDGINPWDLTRAENEHRKDVFSMWRWLRENRPGFENSYISLTAPQIGVRETRRIIGEYVLTQDDWKSGEIFDDHIGFGWKGFSIPYRSMLPKSVDNLLVAGRCMSTDRPVFNSTRHVTDCIVTGMAGGVAAVQGLGQDHPLRDLDIERLTTKLKELGVGYSREWEADA